MSDAEFKIPDLPAAKFARRDIDEVVDSMPEVEELNESSVNKLLKHFVKSQDTNEQRRAMYADDPSKFMDSEIQLADSLKRLQLISTVPHLFPLLFPFLEKFVLNLIHPNPDIQLETIRLFQEWIELDEEQDDLQYIVPLADQLLTSTMIDALVSFLNLMSLEESDFDRQCVFAILTLIETCVELGATFAERLFPAVQTYLLERVGRKKIDSHSQFASELIATCLQSSEKCRQSFLQTTPENPLDSLLMVLARFRKETARSTHEVEVLENMTDAICSCVLTTQGQQLFISLEGLELCLRLLQSKSKKSALKILSYVITSIEDADLLATSCDRLIEHGCLKFLGAVLMQTHAENDRQKGDKMEDEYCTSVLVGLVTVKNQQARVLFKFLENDFEKTERLVELLSMYQAKTKKFEEKKKHSDLDEDELYMEKLDVGWMIVQNVTFILGMLIVAGIDELSLYIEKLLRLRQMDHRSLIHILKNQQDHLSENSTFFASMKELIAKLEISVNGSASQD